MEISFRYRHWILADWGVFLSIDNDERLSRTKNHKHHSERCSARLYSLDKEWELAPVTDTGYWLTEESVFHWPLPWNQCKLPVPVSVPATRYKFQMVKMSRSSHHVSVSVETSVFKQKLSCFITIVVNPSPVHTQKVSLTCDATWHLPFPVLLMEPSLRPELRHRGAVCPTVYFRSGEDNPLLQSL